MKKIIGLVIGGIVLIIITVCYFKYVYVPKNMTYRIKYENLRKEIKGNSLNEVVGELTNHGLHTRLGFQIVKESITYTFDIVNDGSIDAKLLFDPIIIGKDNIFKKYVSRYLTYENGEDIKKGDTLKVGERVTVQYKIIYAEKELDTSPNGNHFEVSLYFPYVQDR